MKNPNESAPLTATSQKQPSTSSAPIQPESVKSKKPLPSTTPSQTPKQSLPDYISFQETTSASKPWLSEKAGLVANTGSKTKSWQRFQNISTIESKESSITLKTPGSTGSSGKDWNKIKIIRLHEEIKAFHDAMMPLPEVQIARENVVDRIAAAVKNLWHGAKVEVFGSFRTGLYLPTSDIDLVVFGCWKVKPLHTLKDELLRMGISDEEKIIIIDKASVPIVKLTDKLTGIKVDISFNITNGLTGAKLIQEFIRQFPSLSYLVLILKQFVYQRDLNEVFTGGIGSYSLILLAVSYLQLQARGEGEIADVNYGVQLMEFFELYGLLFNYYRVGINVRDGGSYVKKDESGRGRMSLYIQDPISPENDVARGTYNLAQIQTAFSHAYYALCNEVLHSRLDDFADDRSILACIIDVGSEAEISSAALDSAVKTLKFSTPNVRTPTVKGLYEETGFSTGKRHQKLGQNSEKKRKRDHSPNLDYKSKQRSSKSKRNYE